MLFGESFSVAALYADVVRKFELGLCDFEKLTIFSSRVATCLSVAGIPDPGIASAFTETTISMINRLHESNTNQSINSLRTDPTRTKYEDACRTVPVQTTTRQGPVSKPKNSKPCFQRGFLLGKQSLNNQESCSKRFDSEDNLVRSNPQIKKEQNASDMVERQDLKPSLSNLEIPILKVEQELNPVDSYDDVNLHSHRSDAEFKRGDIMTSLQRNLADSRLSNDHRDENLISLHVSEESVETNSIDYLFNRFHSDFDWILENGMRDKSFGFVSLIEENMMLPLSGASCNSPSSIKSHHTDDNVDADKSSINRHVESIDEFYKTVKPDMQTQYVTRGIHNVHLRPPEQWSNNSTLKHLLSQYPTVHEDSDDNSKLNSIITSFIVITDPSYDRDAFIQIYTTYDSCIYENIDLVKRLSIMDEHVKLLCDMVLKNILNDYPYAVIQLHDDITMRHELPTARFYPTKLLRREVSRHVRVVSTSFDTKLNNGIRQFRYTKYNSCANTISGLQHPLYNVTGYAFRYDSKNNDVESTSSLNDLLNISIISKLDLTSPIFKQIKLT